MPDKEGSDDKKTTKGVVKKKQKQMMGEEGYDHYRDRILMRGGDHRSKETRERSNTPSSDSKRKGKTVMQKELEKKYGKGKSALDMVKADHKDEIMDVGKKKKKKANVQDEFDLTKIAEAFGGYVVEANGKNGKKNNKKRDSIDDFIDAENPFDVKAQKDAQRDIEQTGGTDPRFKKSSEGQFSKGGKFRKPEKNPLRKKDGEIEPDSVKFTQRPGEKPVKSYIDPSQIDPKIAAREKAKRKESKKKPTAAELAKDRDEKLGAKSFKKDVGGEKIISPTMKDRLEKATAKPKRARKRRSDARSYDQVKADIDIADAAKKANKRGEYASDYEKRLTKAYDKGLETARETGKPPAGQVLPQARTKTIQGQPQKGQQTDQEKAAQEYNRQQNQLRRLQRQGMGDSGATPFPQPPFPDPQTGPSSPFASPINPKGNKPFNIFRKDSKPEPDPSQTQYLDKESGRRFDMDNPEDRKKYLRQQGKEKFIQQAPDKRSKVELGADPNYDPDEGGKFTAQRGGESLTRGARAKTNFGREFSGMMSDMQKAQTSFVGAMGGVFAKAVSPAAAGAEAGLRYVRGDKTGAALSALQGLGGGLGFGAGVINALRMMNPKGTAKLALRKQVSPEKEAMASAAGAGFVTQARDTLNKVGFPELPNKQRAIRVSAKQ